MKKLYLDLDGVILTKNGEESKHLKDFLGQIINEFDCYWLTTHCKGDNSPVLEYLKDKVSKESLEYLKTLKPTNWDTLKTEAIDFQKDFIWMDDYIMESEKEILKKNNALNKFIKIDLKNDPDQLKEEYKKVTRKLNFRYNIIVL